MLLRNDTCLSRWYLWHCRLLQLSLTSVTSAMSAARRLLGSTTDAPPSTHRQLPIHLEARLWRVILQHPGQ
ncbi:uncharacterized protein B0J16DRAFT_335970 [Fusarium flagelliforme]|uniref:uncharacterized protein n=1 Tax=Fusarium flagelliforme TaxID=2675880 RepID=UPI001E8E04D1|nr:uncharacterized protein B0J16DRAFT_335970 [Fusarium flagelliforme]KAH7193770.1 hypothetical protein B0J16DRAFT_335970 [Fusarium flagelliforme]